jgi:hypothetical protein
MQTNISADEFFNLYGMVMIHFFLPHFFFHFFHLFFHHFFHLFFFKMPKFEEVLDVVVDFFRKLKRDRSRLLFGHAKNFEKWLKEKCGITDKVSIKLNHASV